MNKAVLLLALFAVSAFAAGTCTQNKLAKSFDLDFETDPVDGTDFKYCTSLQGTGKSCCSSTVVDGFQGMVDDQITAGSAKVASRDKSLLSLRNSAIAASSSLDSLKSAVASLSTASAALLEAFGFSSIEDEFESFQDDLQDNIDAFATFQSDRTTCIKYLLEVQAAAWCLACSLDANTDTYVDSTTGDITLDTDSMGNVVDNCFPYIDSSNTQNGAITIYYGSKLFSALADFVNTVAGGTTPSTDDMEELLAELLAVGDPTATTTDDLAVKTPANCDKDDCDWIFSNFIVNGLIDWDSVTQGGELVGSITGDDEEESSTGDEEEEEEETTSVRRLAATAWPADTSDAGVSADAWVDNPGDVDAADTSALRTGVIASVLALFALLF